MSSDINQILLNEILGQNNDIKGAHSIRINGKAHSVGSSENVIIEGREKKDGIKVTVKPNTKDEKLHIPVLITDSGINDFVYNDFYIGENCDITIIAGCGIHNSGEQKSEHDGIHSFYLSKGAKVKYYEKHFANGDDKVKKVFNPTTKIYQQDNSEFVMETIQISGVTDTERKTYAELANAAKLVITEKLLTTHNQTAMTSFEVNLKGEDSSVHVTSRSVAEDSSQQLFLSKINGNNKCFGHVECDAIIKNNAKVQAIPEITAAHVEANLIHEAAIGKIAGDQIIKLMTLGLDEREAEAAIITGFLR